MYIYIYIYTYIYVCICMYMHIYYMFIWCLLGVQQPRYRWILTVFGKKNRSENRTHKRLKRCKGLQWST